MVAVLETWTLVGDRDPDWAEVPVSGGDVNLDRKRKTKTEIEDGTISMGWLGCPAQHRLRMEVLRMDPRGVCCPSCQSG